MAHTYTTNYGLIKPEYMSRQTANPPAPGDNPYLSGLWATMDTIDTQLYAAEQFRQNLIGSGTGLLYRNGVNSFERVNLSPLFEKQPAAGRYYPLQGPFAASLVTKAGVANRIEIHPCLSLFDMTGSPVTINLSIMVTTAVSGNVRILVYSASDSTGQPGGLLGLSGNLSTATTGVKTAAVSLTGITSLPAGTRLWAGVWAGQTATLRAVPLSNAWSWGGVGDSSSSTFGTVLRRTVAFADPAPDPWGYNSSEIVYAVSPYAVFVSG